MSKTTYKQVVRQIQSAMNTAIGRVTARYAGSTTLAGLWHPIPSSAVIRVDDVILLEDYFYPQRSYNDVSGASDFLNNVVNKMTAEEGIFSDKLAIYFEANRQESIWGTDWVELLFQQGRDDVVPAADMLAAVLDKPLYDIGGGDDMFSLSVAKYLLDGSQLSDVLSLSKGLATSDPLKGGDTVVLSVDKALVELLSGADSLTKDLTRYIADSLYITDEFYMSRGMTTSDSANGSDIVAKNLQKNLLDSYSNSEAIHLTHENYVAPGYLELGYVGAEYDY